MPWNRLLDAYPYHAFSVDSKSDLPRSFGLIVVIVSRWMSKYEVIIDLSYVPMSFCVVYIN